MTQHPLETTDEALRLLHRSLRRAMREFADRLSHIQVKGQDPGTVAEVKGTFAVVAAFEGLMVDLGDLRAAIRAVLRGPRADWGKAFVAAESRMNSLQRRVERLVKRLED
jgi:hypothetical protein